MCGVSQKSLALSSSTELGPSLKPQRHNGALLRSAAQNVLSTGLKDTQALQSKAHAMRARDVQASRDFQGALLCSGLAGHSWHRAKVYRRGFERFFGPDPADHERLQELSHVFFEVITLCVAHGR